MASSPDYRGRTGSSVIAQMLSSYGVDHVFFVPAILMEALAEMEIAGITRIMAHSEKAAAYMADGYSRVNWKPSVCMAQNIGASNLASGLRDAKMAGTPIIAISGGPTSKTRYRNSYQEIEDFQQFDSVTKFNARIDEVGRIPDLIRQAFREATSGGPGPVHLQIAGPLGELAEQSAVLTPSIQPDFKSAPAFRPLATDEQISSALDKLTSAHRPVIVAGGGAVVSGAHEEVIALAEMLQAPIATSLNAKGIIRDDHPLSVGVVGSYSRECANKVVAKADLVFFIGSRTGGQVTNGWKVPTDAADIIQLDIEPNEIGRNYPKTLPLYGDARQVLRQLLKKLQRRPRLQRSRWVQEFRSLVSDWRSAEQKNLESGSIPIRPERLCKAISNVLPENGIVVSDTGHSGMWSSTMIDFLRPGQRYIRCAGSLGWSFPASLGAKCAAPDRTVICFNGDGAFYYHLAELETAVRHKISTVTIVNNNAAFNQEINLVDAAYRNIKGDRATELWKLRGVNFADVARSFGAIGFTVTSAGDLEDAIEEGIAIDRPVVIDVKTDVEAMAKHAWQPNT